MVRIDRPPPRIPPTPIFSALATAAHLVRIFDPTRYDTTSTGFRHWGPIQRFDHHQVETLTGMVRPAFSASRGVYYCGLTLACCLVELFGDTRLIEPDDRRVAIVHPTRQFQLLDLRGSGAMAAGSVAALAKVADRSVSQAWARYFYESPAAYGSIDGIHFLNAHNDEDAFVLFERAEGALTLIDERRLDAASLRPAILQAAAANGLILEV